MRNKAKPGRHGVSGGPDEGRKDRCAKQTQFPAGPGGTRADGCCTNKPNPCHYADAEIGVPRRAIMPNKAKLGQDGISGEWHVGQMRQTNPISAGQARCTNKANSGLRRGPGADYAKQTQSGAARPVSGGRLCETKPNSGRTGYLGDGVPGRWRLCDIASMPRFGKQSQSRQSAGGTACTNKADFRRAGLPTNQR
jgi:hypothetical protein